MFSGIVETTGYISHLVQSNGCKHFAITPAVPFTDLAVGDSVAINGVCLTITHFHGENFHVSAVPETLRLTNLGLLTLHDKVNLERSLAANSRIGGHFVQGHVDGVGNILSITPEGAALLVKIRLPPTLAKYVVKKGYIGLDGMSITVIDVGDDWFTITLIPHTQAVTITKQYQVGSCINIEVDILGKYIEKLVGATTHETCA